VCREGRGLANCCAAALCGGKNGFFPRVADHEMDRCMSTPAHKNKCRQNPNPTRTILARGALNLVLSTSWNFLELALPGLRPNTPSTRPRVRDGSERREGRTSRTVGTISGPSEDIDCDKLRRRWPEPLVEEELRGAHQSAHGHARVEAHEELPRVCDRTQHCTDGRVLERAHAREARLHRAAT